MTKTNPESVPIAAWHTIPNEKEYEKVRKLIKTAQRTRETTIAFDPSDI